jgi:hypothetical protein
MLRSEAPAPCEEDLQQELRQLQNQMSHLQRRLEGQGERAKSSAQGANRNRRPAPTYRPQHERQTLAPRRPPSPTCTYLRGHNTLPPHRTRWPQRQEGVLNRPTQQRRSRSPLREPAPIRVPPPPRREEVRDRPLRNPSTPPARRGVPPILPTPPIPPRVHGALTENNASVRGASGIDKFSTRSLRTWCFGTLRSVLEPMVLSFKRTTESHSASLRTWSGMRGTTTFLVA